jgi:hypothetical protein
MQPYDYENYDEDDYLEAVDPANWKEHFPGDDGYVPYVYSLDQADNVIAKCLAILNQSGLDYYTRTRTEYYLRAIKRDRRDMKMGHHNEPHRK